MEERVYTHAAWRVREGGTDAFIAAWTELGAAFNSLARPPVGTGTLIQSVEDPLLFYSFGTWSSAADVAAMRADPSAREAIARVVALCSDASPGLYRLVREVNPVDAGAGDGH